MGTVRDNSVSGDLKEEGRESCAQMGTGTQQSVNLDYESGTQAYPLIFNTQYRR